MLIGAEMVRGSPGHAVDAVSPTLVTIENGNDPKLSSNGDFCAPALVDKIVRLKGEVCVFTL
jgi:hypothetical protein